MATIDDLPAEVLMQIFSYIEIGERQRNQIVCSRWQSIIQRMWITINKLEFILTVDPSRYRNMSLTENRISYATIRISVLAKILQIFNDDQSDDYVRDRYHRMSNLTYGIPYHIINLIQHNKSLNSVEVSSFRDDTIEMKFRKSSANQLQHLMLDIRIVQNEIEWWEVLNDLLEHSRSMRYLSLHTVSLSLLEKIWNLGMLESLHITSLPFSTDQSDQFKNMGRLRNLRSVSVPQCRLVNDNFLFAIGENCKELQTIFLRDCECVTAVGFKALESLPNLRQVILFGVGSNIKIFDLFTYVEELCCSYTRSRIFDKATILRFLQRSKNLKKYHFFNEEFNKLFKEVAIGAGIEVELADDHDVKRREWRKMSGL